MDIPTVGVIFISEMLLCEIGMLLNPGSMVKNYGMAFRKQQKYG